MRPDQPVGGRQDPGRVRGSVPGGQPQFDGLARGVEPDEVHAGRRTFQALGSRFNVRLLNPTLVEVIVIEGEVKILFAAPQLPDTPARRREPLVFGESTLRVFEMAETEPGFQILRTIDAMALKDLLAWHQADANRDQVSVRGPSAR